MNGDLRWRDLWHIRLSLLVCAVVALLALTLAAVARMAANAEREATARARQELLSLQQRLSALQGEQVERVIQLQRVHRLVPGGGSKPESRLHWLRLLQQAAARHHVAALDYELEPAAATGPGAPQPAALPLSRLRLRLDLLHEEDLLGLLADLRRQFRALLHVRSCSIERLPEAESEGGWAMLRSQCNVDLLSLRELS